MIKNMKKYGYIAFVLCVLAGCASQKQISYLQDVPDDYRQKITQDYDLRIHPDDLLSIMVNSKDPAKYANIPVRLLNTMDSTAPGTLISNDTEKGKIKAVAAKDNITAIKIKSSRMLLAHGFLRKVFEIFESYQTSIDMICTSEVGVSVSIDNTKHLNEILDDLKKYGTVTVDKDMCIICVVGDLEWENVGFEAKALDAMRDIPVRMISFGGSNYNISFLIRECDKKQALQSLSDALFNE